MPHRRGQGRVASHKSPRPAGSRARPPFAYLTYGESGRRCLAMFQYLNRGRLRLRFQQLLLSGKNRSLLQIDEDRRTAGPIVVPTDKWPADLADFPFQGSRAPLANTL